MDTGRVGWRQWVVPLAVLVGAALQQLAFGWPDSPVGWTMFVAGTLLAAAPFAGLNLWLARPEPATRSGVLPAGLRWVRTHTRLRTVVLLTVATAVGLVVGMASPALAVQVRRRLHGCEAPAEVRVLTSTEQLGPAAELADGYERWTAAHNGGCPTANLYVFPASPQRARTAVGTGWLDDSLAEVGPRPDVWLADSSLDVDDALVWAGRYNVTLPIAGRELIGTTPVLLGVPAGQVPEDLRSSRSALVWRRLWTKAEELHWRVLRPDPTVSVVGELATYALYTSVDRTTESAPGPGRAHQVEQQIADALDHGGFPLGGMTDLLCRYRTASIPNPVILTEQALVRFNQGLPPGAGCDLRLPQPLAVGACLFGIYPPDTPSVDHQFVRLQWDGTTTPAARTAVAFGRWLSTVDGQRAVLRGGVRPRGMSESGDPLNPRFCAQTSAAYGRQPLSRASIEQTRQRYAQARRPGRVLLAVDGSGSMGTLIDGRRSRLVVAIRGLQRSLALLGTADEVGLWAFPSGASGRGVRQLVPIGRRDAPYRGTARSDAAVAALSGVSPAGGTPLYDTILAGVGALAAGGEDEVVALVVLTDGMDTTSRVSGPGPVEQVAGKRVRVFVVAVGEASCVVPFLVAVTEHTGGSCRQADFDTVDDVLVELLGSMWGGDHESG